MPIKSWVCMKDQTKLSERGNSIVAAKTLIPPSFSSIQVLHFMILEQRNLEKITLTVVWFCFKCTHNNKNWSNQSCLTSTGHQETISVRRFCAPQNKKAKTQKDEDCKVNRHETWKERSAVVCTCSPANCLLLSWNTALELSWEEEKRSREIRRQRASCRV